MTFDWFDGVSRSVAGLVVFGFGLLMAAAFIRQFSRRWARPVAVTGLLILGFTAYYRQADFSEGIRTVVDRFIKREQPEVDRTVHDLSVISPPQRRLLPRADLLKPSLHVRDPACVVLDT